MKPVENKNINKDSQIVILSPSAILKKKIKRRNILQKKKQMNSKFNKQKVNNGIGEKIIKLQQQQYQSALEEVKTDIRELCLELHDQIQYIQKNMIYNQQQGVQEIILEFYKDIFFDKYMMDDITKFSQDSIISIWNQKYKELVFEYVRYPNVIIQ